MRAITRTTQRLVHPRTSRPASLARLLVFSPLFCLTALSLAATLHSIPSFHSSSIMAAATTVPPSGLHKLRGSVDWSEESFQVVPDVVSDNPKNLAMVEFDRETRVEEMGQILTPQQAKKQPKVTWEGASDQELYTVMMVDPDAPSRKTHEYRNWLHWLCLNVPGLNIDRGNDACPYKGPTPPAGSGLHRYVILVYKQKQPIDAANIPDDKRKKFDVHTWLKQHKDGYGSEPSLVAGNMFQAQSGGTGGEHKTREL